MYFAFRNQLLNWLIFQIRIHFAKLQTNASGLSRPKLTFGTRVTPTLKEVPALCYIVKIPCLYNGPWRPQTQFMKGHLSLPFVTYVHTTVQYKLFSVIIHCKYNTKQNCFPFWGSLYMSFPQLGRFPSKVQPRHLTLIQTVCPIIHSFPCAVLI